MVSQVYHEIFKVKEINNFLYNVWLFFLLFMVTYSSPPLNIPSLLLNLFPSREASQGRWFSPGTPASSTTKTGRHDIAEILLKVALNTKIQIQIQERPFFIVEVVAS